MGIQVHSLFLKLYLHMSNAPLGCVHTEVYWRGTDVDSMSILDPILLTLIEILRVSLDTKESLDIFRNHTAVSKDRSCSFLTWFPHGNCIRQTMATMARTSPIETGLICAGKTRQKAPLVLTLPPGKLRVPRVIQAEVFHQDYPLVCTYPYVIRTMQV